MSNQKNSEKLGESKEKIDTEMIGMFISICGLGMYIYDNHLSDNGFGLPDPGHMKDFFEARWYSHIVKFNGGGIANALIKDSKSQIKKLFSEKNISVASALIPATAASIMEIRQLFDNNPKTVFDPLDFPAYFAGGLAFYLCFKLKGIDFFGKQ